MSPLLAQVLLKESIERVKVAKAAQICQCELHDVLPSSLLLTICTVNRKGEAQHRSCASNGRVSLFVPPCLPPVHPSVAISNARVGRWQPSAHHFVKGCHGIITHTHAWFLTHISLVDFTPILSLFLLIRGEGEDESTCLLRTPYIYHPSSVKNPIHQSSFNRWNNSQKCIVNLAFSKSDI